MWLGERLGSSTPDLISGLAAVAARTHSIGIGAAVLLLPAYQPAHVAKALATIDLLSNGRLLPAFVGHVLEELRSLGIRETERGRRMDEGLALLRRLWAESGVSHW